MVETHDPATTKREEVFYKQTHVFEKYNEETRQYENAWPTDSDLNAIYSKEIYRIESTVKSENRFTTTFKSKHAGLNKHSGKKWFKYKTDSIESFVRNPSTGRIYCRSYDLVKLRGQPRQKLWRTDTTLSRLRYRWADTASRRDAFKEWLGHEPDDINRLFPLLGAIYPVRPEVVLGHPAYLRTTGRANSWGFFLQAGSYGADTEVFYYNLNRMVFGQAANKDTLRFLTDKSYTHGSLAMAYLMRGLVPRANILEFVEETRIHDWPSPALRKIFRQMSPEQRLALWTSPLPSDRRVHMIAKKMWLPESPSWSDIIY